MNARNLIVYHLLPIIIGILMVFASPVDARTTRGPVIPGHSPVGAPRAPTGSPSLDEMVTEILERPLFSPSRQAVSAVPSTPAVEEKEPPKLPGRLAGVAILPEVREAL